MTDAESVRNQPASRVLPTFCFTVVLAQAPVRLNGSESYEVTVERDVAAKMLDGVTLYALTSTRFRRVPEAGDNGERNRWQNQS